MAAARAVEMLEADAAARDLRADEATRLAREAQQGLTLLDRLSLFFGKPTPAAQHARELREKASSLSWAAEVNRPGPFDFSEVRQRARDGADRAAERHARWMRERRAELLRESEALERIEFRLMDGDTELAQRIRVEGVCGFLVPHDESPRPRLVPTPDSEFSLPTVPTAKRWCGRSRAPKPLGTQAGNTEMGGSEGPASGG
jgi:hypothetical protein